MARKTAKEARRETEVPEGFTPITAERGDLCFIRPAEGLVVRGELIGRFKRRGQDDDTGPKWYYQIKIDAGVRGVRYADGESEETLFEPGTIVNVDERTALEVLHDHVGSGKRVKVWIKYGERVPVKGTNRTFWQIDVAIRQMAEGGGKDIPF